MENKTQFTIDGLRVQLLARKNRTIAPVCTATDSFLSKPAMFTLGTGLSESAGDTEAAVWALLFTTISLVCRRLQPQHPLLLPSLPCCPTEAGPAFRVTARKTSSREEFVMPNSLRQWKGTFEFVINSDIQLKGGRKRHLLNRRIFFFKPPNECREGRDWHTLLRWRVSIDKQGRNGGDIWLILRRRDWDSY